MKILVIHNRYQQKGGEDTTFEQETKLLRQTEDVETLVFQNDPGWKGALQFFMSIWNFSSAFKIRHAIRHFRPDIIHVHNWHYAIGPVVVRTVHRNKIPLILTVQNFRLLCPSAALLYKNTLFLDSITASFPWSAVSKKVYRDSYFQTFWLAFTVWVHKKTGTWNMVDRYILQTELAKSVFLSSTLGVAERKFSIKPNFIEDPVSSPKDREDFFLYIGRLSDEKGVATLLEAFETGKHELYIGGDGPLKELVEKASAENPRIRYLGLLEKSVVLDMMRRCSVLLFPSIWYEGMPLTLIEAFAVGTPVIASNLGAMSSMITDQRNGLHFTAGNAVELAGKLDFWSGLTKEDKRGYSERARKGFEDLYTPEINRKLILAIYQSVIKNKSAL